VKTKAILLAVIACMMLSSCNRVEKAKDTKVMYAVSIGSHNGGTFTLLVDADGKPMIHEGE
jgi:hypothetical protein